jgi:diadenosine tetraphosphate (Ap4A) HIT family hydrolase
VCAALLGEAPYGDPVVYESPWVVAYLRRHDIQRGYTIVTSRVHVVEPFELPEADAAAYWADVLRVARAVQRHFAPKKLNYETWGNAEPHLHTHVVPRYDVDPHPGGGFPFWLVNDPPLLAADALERDVDGLRTLLDIVSS